MSTRRRLSQLLLTSHVGLILLFALLLLTTGFGTVRSAVVGQARTEAERALTEGRKRLREWQRELEVAADLLAEQPTLGFYLGRGQLTKARQLVTDFHGTSHVDYLRVQLNGRTVAEEGPRPPVFAGGLAFDAHGTAWRVATRAVPGVPAASIVLAEALGDRLLAPPGEAPAQVHLQPPIPPPTAPEPWRLALRTVAESGEPMTVEDVGPMAAARIVSVASGDGTTRALLSASVGKAWVKRRTVEWLAAFGGALLATLALALGLAVLLASRIARPFAQLAADAGRLGTGDLDTPVPRPTTFLAEPVALADSMEKMRARVAALTTSERRQREELDAILNGVDEGIVDIDQQGIVRYANRQFLELVGLPHEAVLGAPLDRVVAPLPAAPEDQALQPSTHSARCVPAGGGRPLTVRHLRDSGPRTVLVVREENATEAARAMRDHILANLSHEFQTPLSAQTASIELLRDHLRGGSDKVALRLADAQFRGTMRLSQLVENLLESVRIESGEMRLRRQPVDLAEVVGEAIELMQPLIDQRDQRIVADIQPGPLFTGDGPRLLSVVVNLLANANKFAPDQTAIWITTQWEARQVTVWVEDEGPGLPSSYSARDMFAPFRRAPDEEPSQRGTGLGLAIVHAVVAAHGGQVRIGAPARQHGTRIGVVLPVGESR